jgi:hypothetical protein
VIAVAEISHLLPGTSPFHKTHLLLFRYFSNEMMVKCLAIFGALLMVTQAQQFDGVLFPYEELGLSDSCFAAVNLTIPCPAWLARHTGIEYVEKWLYSSMDVLM